MERLSLKEQKTQLRQEARALLANLTHERRDEAKILAAKFFETYLRGRGHVLSFFSLPFEIDTMPLNKFLLQSDKLLLPKIENESLGVYKINNLSEDLEKHPFGILEPNPTHAQKFNPQEIDIVLVPALLFDNQKMRLGHGFGYYDRFLKTLPNSEKIGLGFLEQSYSKILPSNSLDVHLTQVYLF